MTRYGGRKAVVLDGATGLGLAVAKRLVEGGARVLLTGRAADGELAAAAAELGPGARVVGTGPAGACASPDALASVVEDALGTVDFVFVHAGTTGPADEGVAPAWGTCRAVRALLPSVHDDGAIVFTAAALPALAVDRAPDGDAPDGDAPDGDAPDRDVPYREPEPGPWACARALAAELAGRGIRVNAVAPGLIALPGGGGAAGRVAERRVPMRRPGTVDEVARAALFLAAEATYTTGAELAVDGGLGPGGPELPDGGARKGHPAAARPPRADPP
ncbi:SDR family NAD(P)-dependent oxidoreductase [Streptomyces sp. I05A-00742]|uniref:SDR family NAD(P)-dependent oxidoreductase n=1 Tax=Streptomyces sp. I05A-00742 TaxID=2732853 RepID=UPI0014889A2B|nr:SDR family oxidoreductase [Streptomyces sp. I05A-00742]